ncbi:MAG: hypothetical protein KAI24_03640 [Planctomycetes bacterium]|nr:hypothetical protein [Planctomycetota bacterium]
MSARNYVIWAICGIAWHAIVTVLVHWRLDPFVPGVVAGLVAGLVAGAMTIRSRVRREGREHWGDLLLTYLVAVVVYATGLFATEVVVDVWFGGASHDLGDLFATYLLYALLYALLWSAVLVPLSFITRRIVWWVGGRGMLPDQT